MKKVFVLIALVCITFFSFTDSKKEATLKKEAKVFQAACNTHCPSQGWVHYLEFFVWDHQMGVDYPQVPRSEDWVHNYYSCMTGQCGELCTRVCYGMM